MIKTLAIPAHIKDDADLANYGDKPMSADEIAQREADLVIAENCARKAKIRSLLDELSAIDVKSIRAIRANETDRLAELENQAQQLRNQLQELN